MSPASGHFTYLNFNLSQSLKHLLLLLTFGYVLNIYVFCLFVSRHLCKYMHIFMYIFPQTFEEEDIRNPRTGVTGCDQLDSLYAWKRVLVFYKSVKHLKPLAISPGPQLGLLRHVFSTLFALVGI